MFKPSAILLNNPNFKVAVNPTDGTVMQLEALVWDFTKHGADTFTYDAVASMDAFTRFSARMDKEEILSEVYHLDLAIQKDWQQIATDLDGTSTNAQLYHDQRLKTIYPQFAGARLLPNLKLERKGLSVEKVWLSLNVGGQQHSEVFASTLNVCPGARMACRFTSDGYPTGRQITEIHAIDLVVEKPAEAVNSKVAHVKHSILTDERSFIDKVISSKHPKLSVEDGEGISLDYSGQCFYQSFTEQQRADLSTGENAELHRRQADQVDTSAFIMSNLRDVEIGSLATTFNVMDHLEPNEVIDIDLSSGSLRGFLEFALTTRIESGPHNSKPVSDRLAAHHRLAVGWDRPKHTLYIATTYSNVGMLDVQLKSDNVLTEVYDVVLVPFSAMRDNELMAIISTDELPFAHYVEQMDSSGEFINRAYVQVTELIWRFNLVS